MNRTLRRTCIVLLISAVALSCGCSHFEHDWDAAAGAKPADRTDMTGRWKGTWNSDSSTHNGGLHCLVTRTDKKTYHIRYAATYGGSYHFNYEMDVSAEQEPQWVKFEGEADLGWLAGGMYHYEGHANAENFLATYRCSADHGQFTMKRP